MSDNAKRERVAKAIRVAIDAWKTAYDPIYTTTMFEVVLADAAIAAMQEDEPELSPLDALALVIANADHMDNWAAEDIEADPLTWLEIELREQAHWRNVARAVLRHLYDNADQCAVDAHIFRVCLGDIVPESDWAK